MQRLCPKCQNWFTGQLLCPQCNVQLLDPSREDATPRMFRTRNPVATPISAWGRLLLGTAIVQMIFHGSRFLIAANVADGSTLLLEVRYLSLLFGAILVGAAHPRPFALGMAFGLLNGGIDRFTGAYLGNSPDETKLMAETAASLGIGVLGAVIGSRVWRGFPPALGLMDVGRFVAMDIQPKAVAPRAAPKVAWARVILGALGATAGVYWASQLREGMFWFSRGQFQATSTAQGQFIDWELAALAVIIGGAFAGANTRTGLRQGILAGALSGLFLVVVYQLVSLGKYPAFEFWFDLLGIRISPGSPFPPELAAFLFLTGLLFGTLGGWMGAELLPPIVPRRRLTPIN